MSEFFSFGQPFNSFYPEEWLLQLLLGLLITVAVLASLLGLGMYVLRAAGLHQLAKKRGIRCAWLAWVPIAGNWILGSISDQYQYVVKGRVKNNRFVLLILSVVAIALGVAAFALSEEVIVGLLSRAIFGGGNVNTVRLVIMTVLAALCVGTAITHLVFSLMAHFDLYRSCVEVFGVICLVATILFCFLEPVFVFVCRDKDQGMPPRKAEPAAGTNEPAPVEHPQAEPAEQVETEQEQPVATEAQPEAVEDQPEIAEQQAEVVQEQPGTVSEQQTAEEQPSVTEEPAEE